MEYLKYSLFLLLLFILSFSSFAAPNRGIAFIHGTNDHRDDAYGGYWKVDFIDSVVQGIENPENFHVVACNFSEYMWGEAAGTCVVDQLINFIDEKKIDDLIIYSHSNGGNVIRWILSNPTYDSRYLRIKNTVSKVIAVAPSSGGTILADEVLEGTVLESTVAWLLGYLSDAVKQQRIGDMLLFNEEILQGSKGRPSLPVPFKVIVGSNVIASPFSSLSYCNGYMENSGLKITRSYLDDCSDGFLNCSSQIIAGNIWFYDTEKTENNEPLSHNQSRHTCAGLDKIIIADLAADGEQP